MNKETIKKNIMKESQDEDTLSFDNQFEIYGLLPSVKSSVKGNVTSDYVLARLSQAEKEFITENYQNAAFARSLFERYEHKGYRYVWNEEKMDWERNKDGSFKKLPISEKEKEILKKMGKDIFGLFMIQPDMIAVLNRNDNMNFLVKLLGREREEEAQALQMIDDRNKLQKFMDGISGKENPENMEDLN